MLAVACCLCLFSPARAEDDAASTDEPTERVVTPAIIKKVHVTTRIVGTDGVWLELKALELDEGASAWDATRTMLTSSDYAYRTGTESTQDVLVSVTHPSDGTTLSLDAATGSGWHLYLNGERYLGSSSSKKLAEGDDVEWRYEVGTFMVRVAVVGPGGTEASYWIAPTTVRMEATQTAWDASLAVFEQSGYSTGRLLSYSSSEDGTVHLESLAALGENGITGEVWQVFVNGEIPPQNVAKLALHAGDSICWYYAGRGEMSLPSFVAETGAASQNPAESISIEGIVAEAWRQAGTSDLVPYAVVDCLSGVSVTGGDQVRALVSERKTLIDPLSQLMGPTVWRSSLSRAVGAKLATGEGVGSVMGLDASLYYVDDSGLLAKLELQ